MSASFDLYGIPETPTLQFTQFLPGVFAPVGSDGVPDPVANPMTTFNYLVNKANMMTSSAQQRPMIRIADQNLQPIAELVGELSCNVEELMSDTGQARLVITYDNWIIDQIVNLTRVDTDVHLIIDPTPTQRSWRTRWGGKIHQINVKRNEDGTSTCEITALSHREHAKRLLIAANPFFAPEIQLPRMWVLPGPIRTILFMTFFVNLARLFVPGLSTITNALNPISWMSTDLANLNPLSWPIQIAFVNPLIDQSRWTAIGANWTDWHSATTDMLKDCGVILRAYTWLEEDIDSPHNELADVINGVDALGVDLADALGLQVADDGIRVLGDVALEALTMPTRNCVIFRLEDMSGQTGPTGTALDGLLNLIGVTTDDLLTSIIVNADTGQTLSGEKVIDVINPTDPVAEAILDVAPKPPTVIWRDSQYDRVPSKQHTLYKAPPLTMMTGGRSPSIVNQAQDFAIQWALSQIKIVVTADEGVFGGAGEGPAPIGSGLAFLYNGELDNSVLAWERLTDPERVAFTGDVAYQEHFERGSQVAYTLASVLTLRQADWNTRAYYGFQSQVISGFPWVVDVDVRLGERAGWEMDNIIYVDQITAIKRSWDRTTPALCNISVGNDQDKQDPIARGVRALNNMYSAFTALLGQGTLFG